MWNCARSNRVKEFTSSSSHFQNITVSFVSKTEINKKEKNSAKFYELEKEKEMRWDLGMVSKSKIIAHIVVIVRMHDQLFISGKYSLIDFFLSNLFFVSFVLF